jgi:hypothetical protein
MVLLTMAPPEWVKLVIEAYRYKEAAKKLAGG